MRCRHRRTGQRLLWVATSALLALFAAADASPAGSRTDSIRLLSSDARGLSFHLVAPEVRLVSRAVDGRACRWPAAGQSDATIDETTELPTLNWLIAVPPSGAASVSWTDLSFHRLDVPDLCPEPPPREHLTMEPDGRIVPVANHGLVGETNPPPLTLNDSGWLRHVPVARLAFHPVARVDADTLVVRTAVHGRVDYKASLSAVDADPPDSLFGVIAREALLNGRALADLPASPREPLVDQVTRQSSDSDPIAASPDALKVIVDRDGPVVIAGADLRAAGWDLSQVDPARLSLECGGRRHALAVHDGSDGRIDPSDELLFFGRAMPGEYARENVYWLTPTGGGTRMATRRGTPTGQATPVLAFTETLHFEHDLVYYQSMHYRDGDDRWMWSGVISPDELFETPLPVTNLATGAHAGRMRIRFQGYTDDRSVSPDHHARVMLNGQLLYDALFDGLGIHEFEFDIPAGLLVEGDNRLSVKSIDVHGAVVDAFFINWIEVDYRAGLRAVADHLAFAAPDSGSSGFELGGFTNGEVTILEVTEPAEAVEITGAAAALGPRGDYTVRFEDVTEGAKRYVAFTPEGAVGPKRIIENAPSRWRSRDLGADYIIVTHPLFAEAIRPLAQRRAAAGLRVATVLIDDVYDEFSYGVFDPRAIRAFLKFAFETWERPAPTYVLLVGESNLDYRLGASAGPQNYVPSMQVDLESGEAGSSDVWFAAVQGDVLPDMAIGRISVTTAHQVETVVGKILSYEAGDVEDQWRHRLVLVADDTDAMINEALNSDLARLLPAGHEARRFDAASYPRDRDLTADIIAAIDEGSLALHFSGHANVDTWSPWPGGGRILQNSDIVSLANDDRLPIYTSASCMTGWVSHNLKPVALSELWVNQPGGGGIAAWNESGLEPPDGQAAMIRAFYRGLYDGRAQSIGLLSVEAAVRTYAQSRHWADIIRQFVLVGDPALVVSGVPAAPPTPLPTVSATPFPTGPAVYLPEVFVDGDAAGTGVGWESRGQQ